MAPKKTYNINTNSRADLERSLAHWKAELKAANTKLSAVHRLLEAVRARKQRAQAVIERRHSQLKKIKHSGRRKAVAVALGYVGTRENPPNSNRGTLIDSWERHWGIIAQPWCGCFAGCMVEKGGADVSSRIVYTPYIYDDAVSHTNGLDKVVWRRGQVPAGEPGDLVLYDFGTAGIKHVGMLVQPWRGGLLQTVEGNTSFGTAGSQDNGGAVARRQRDASLVYAIVSVKWS